MARRIREKSGFPHAEVASVISVGVISFCIYRYISTLFDQQRNQLENEIEQCQERQRTLQSQQDEARDDTVRPLLALTLPMPDDGNTFSRDDFSEDQSQAVGLEGGDANDNLLQSPQPKSVSSRISINSTPASPLTRSILKKLDTFDGRQLWSRMDPQNTGRAHKSTVLEVLENIPELLQFCQQPHDGVEHPIEKAVNKIAGRHEYVSKQRWEQYLSQGNFDIRNFVDTVD